MSALQVVCCSEWQQLHGFEVPNDGTEPKTCRRGAEKSQHDVARLLGLVYNFVQQLAVVHA